MKKIKELEKYNLSTVGFVLYYLGVIKLVDGPNGYKHGKFRILNPFGLVFMIVVIILTPFFSMFTDSTVQENYKDIFETVVLF